MANSVRFFNIVSIIGFLLFHSIVYSQPRRTNSGDLIVIQTHYLTPENNGVIKQLFPPDSIFVKGHKAIEKVYGIKFDGKQVSYPLQKIFFIDFKTRQCQEIDIRGSSVRSQGKKIPLSNKEFGMNDRFKYYGNEAIKSSISKSKGKTIKTIKFTSKNGESSLRDADLEVVFDLYSSGIGLFPNLENRFRGRVQQIKATFPNKKNIITLKVQTIVNFRNQLFDYVDQMP